MIAAANDRAATQLWRRRSRNFALGALGCLAFIFLLKVVSESVLIGLVAAPLMLFVMFFVEGLYCGYRHWQAIRDHEIAGSGSAKTASEKWHKIYPPGVG